MQVAFKLGGVTDELAKIIDERAINIIIVNNFFILSRFDILKLDNFLILRLGIYTESNVVIFLSAQIFSNLSANWSPDTLIYLINDL
jgi:hypothetical protein